MPQLVQVWSWTPVPLDGQIIVEVAKIGECAASRTRGATRDCLTTSPGAISRHLPAATRIVSYQCCVGEVTTVPRRSWRRSENASLLQFRRCARTRSPANAVAA